MTDEQIAALAVEWRRYERQVSGARTEEGPYAASSLEALEAILTRRADALHRALDQRLLEQAHASHLAESSDDAF